MCKLILIRDLGNVSLGLYGQLLRHGLRRECDARVLEDIQLVDSLGNMTPSPGIRRKVVVQSTTGKT